MIGAVTGHELAIKMEHTLLYVGLAVHKERLEYYRITGNA